MESLRIGFGTDCHRLKTGESLILGGVKISSKVGTVAHSDGDVICHAICDSLLGAAGLGDIGEHFPDSDPQFAGIDSTDLLRRVIQMLNSNDFSISNVDITVITEKPKLTPYKDKIQNNLKEIIKSPLNIKATTKESLGYIGEGRAIEARAVSLLYKNKES